MPPATVRSWVLGRHYPTRSGPKFFKPIVARPDTNIPLLSFVNLVECHVLSAIRRQHTVPLPSVRKALDYLTTHFASKHPLVEQKFETDGIDLFVERYGQLINVSKEGQTVMRGMIKTYLRRIERDQEGNVLRLFPFTRSHPAPGPKIIVIDPFVSFGKRTIVGTGIPTSIIADRYKTGESVDELAEDYGRQKLEIEEAIRSELQAA